MSRTGNLLFPDDQDDGWVTSIQKALGKEENDGAVAGESPDGIPDPVADAADAVFSKMAADVAADEAIFASGWSADTVKAEKAPAPQDASQAPKLPEQPAPPAPRDPGRDALESVVNPDVEGGEDLDFGEDPVAAEADATFAEVSANTAARDAIEAAGWTADASLPGDVLADIETAVAAKTPAPGAPPSAPVDQEANFAGWSAAVTGSEQETLPPEELQALDAVIAEVGSRQNQRFIEIDDPVGFAADAVFAETAAQVADRQATLAARKEDEEDRTAALDAAGEAAAKEETESRRMLSAEEGAALENDPVALEADATFARLAAEVSIDDAILAARWRARPGPDDVVAALGEKPDPTKSPEFLEIHDLVRAEAEIAFDDAAYDLAYNTVDNLVTGEAAALNAFDQAIQSGADPEEALTAAISAAEAVDPRAFGLTQVAARPINPDDFIFAGRTPLRPRQDRDGPAVKDKEGESEPAASEEVEEIAVTTLEDTLGEGFNDDPAAQAEASDADALLGTGYTFVFDPDLITIPALGPRNRDRDDELVAGTDADDRIDGTDGADTLTGSAGADNIFGYAGDDVLAGRQGADTLSGGAGADEFLFDGGSGADALARAASLGTDTITDFSNADGDSFGLSDADFGFGNAGTLSDGTDYFESLSATLSATPLDASSGTAGAAIVVLGDGSGTAGVDVYYTDDASAMTASNSYQIADVTGANTGDISAGDFSLRS
ncbi:MAG: calcium-binding protein [Proteobacteria bacterium]|nr:calcium-binding protein [Pseudomonadota bacterium]MDA1021773.1 calcium-binding protein [Pseudomonadota bacterium]